MVDRNFVIDYLEWYAVADNERALMYMKQNSSGKWSLHVAACLQYNIIKQRLPVHYVRDSEFNFSVLPHPFDVLVGTLTDCVALVKCFNPCDGPMFLYQWALRNSFGPTEEDIFKALHRGGTMLEVLEDNSLISRTQDDQLNWQAIIVQHFYQDMQYQPLHRRDREGILQHSVTDATHDLYPG